MVEFSDQKDELFWTLEEPIRASTHLHHVYVTVNCCGASRTHFQVQVMVPMVHHLASCLRLLILSLYIRLCIAYFTLKNIAFVLFAFQCQEFNCVRTLRVKVCVEECVVPALRLV